ncbi:conserved hypothetical protein [Cellulomonas flavigena DSM 20109]|uniref:Uncharacterized protein n=1 Tax=Cellulomonas flavigena (strain ATCC 482 / DSM 20109 / BCRC 11376 / JCM 18109 / NBRC 3775 / NCIMB 8073 / NRS 134) TaxID=446466 RepID=D5UHX7_CELFN|nr:hypothetical protein [Cellulomonas flavigena]ADG73401.1 conserved hypothetical protein [Cellulomonas flavigena DSM 20109]
MSTTAASPAHSLARLALVAVLSAACWLAWMGWDTQYQVDPATGDATGPYEAWQVIGCAVSLVGVAVLAVRLLGAGWAVPVVAVAFTLAWVGTSAPSDESGLWAVGAVLVLLGTAVGTVVVALVVRAVRRRGRPRHDAA